MMNYSHRWGFPSRLCATTLFIAFIDLGIYVNMYRLLHAFINIIIIINYVCCNDVIHTTVPDNVNNQKWRQTKIVANNMYLTSSVGSFFEASTVGLVHMGKNSKYLEQRNYNDSSSNTYM